ncbi:MAG: hypothetical protein RSB51_00855 [Clostridia bacterium]
MKKIISISLIIMILAINTQVFAASIPIVNIGGPNRAEVQVGGSVSYTVAFYGANSINLKSSDIGIAGSGVTAAKTVSGSGNTRTVTLSNIQGEIGKVVSIAIRSGVATNASGSSVQTPNSIGFVIKQGQYDNVKPSITVTGPSKNNVDLGDSVVYNVNYSDKSGIKNISLNSSSIALFGFTANVSISGTGTSRRITLNNVQGAEGGNKYISIKSGTAADMVGNLAYGVERTTKFCINAKPVETPSNQEIKPVENKQTDVNKPTINISAPSATSILAGETIRYVLTYNDDQGLQNISLKIDDVKLIGFTADITIENDENKRVIILSNVQGDLETEKYISINSETAVDLKGNKAEAVNKTIPFKIEKKAEINDKKYNDGRPNDWIENPNTGKNI